MEAERRARGGTERPVAEGIVRVAARRVREELHERHARGERVVTLVELAGSTALAPETAVAVLRRVETPAVAVTESEVESATSPSHQSVP